MSDDRFSLDAEFRTKSGYDADELRIRTGLRQPSRGGRDLYSMAKRMAL